MTNFIGNGVLTAAVAAGILNGNSIWAEPYGSILPTSLSLTYIVSTFIPDVYIGINRPISDRIKNLAYHEIAHASHYTLVGTSYWATLIYATILADFNDGRPHGFSTSVNAGYLSVAEGWAQCIDLLYSSRTNPFPTRTLLWGNRIEETHNEVAMHIPIGLHFDLIDSRAQAGVEPVLSCLQDGTACFNVRDDVDGFTLGELFGLLGPGTTDMTIFKTELENNLLPSTTNTQQRIDNLFFDYGIF